MHNFVSTFSPFKSSWQNTPPRFTGTGNRPPYKTPQKAPLAEIKRQVPEEVKKQQIYEEESQSQSQSQNQNVPQPMSTVSMPRKQEQKSTQAPQMFLEQRIRELPRQQEDLAKGLKAPNKKIIKNYPHQMRPDIK